MSLDTRWIMVALVILLFMFVTIGHVASYAGSFEEERHQWLGYPYALGVDFAIGVCAWLTRWGTTRRLAWIAYLSFVIASGAMNAAAIKPWLLEFPENYFAGIYALFPTVAIGLLGFLARKAEEVTERGGKKRGLARLFAGTRESAGEIPQESRKNPARQARIADWREIYQGMNGDYRKVDADIIVGLLKERNLAAPSRRSLQGWAQEANEKRGVV